MLTALFLLSAMLMTSGVVLLVHDARRRHLRSPVVVAAAPALAAACVLSVVCVDDATPEAVGVLSALAFLAVFTSAFVTHLFAATSH